MIPLENAHEIIASMFLKFQEITIFLAVLFSFPSMEKGTYSSHGDRRMGGLPCNQRGCQ